MGEFAKVVRWSAPGSVLLLVAAAVVVSANAIGRALWTPAQRHLGVSTAVDSGTATLTVLAALPMGFLTYQVYYYAYSRTRGFFFSYVHMDVALAVEEVGHQIEGLRRSHDWVVMRADGLFVRWRFHTYMPGTAGRLTTLWLYPRQAVEVADTSVDPGPGAIRRAPESSQGLSRNHLDAKQVLAEYARDRENNWLQLESQLHAKLRRRGGDSERDFKDIERLADIFHTLGATKTAVAYGLGTGIVTWVWPQLAWHSVGIGLNAALVTAISLAPSCACSIWLYFVLHHNREHSQRRRIAMIESALQSPEASSEAAELTSLPS